MKWSGIGLLVVCLFLTTACSNGAYNSDEAIERGDVVVQNGVENPGPFIEFVKSVEDKNEATLRITGYTKEGDPVFHDVEYDGSEFGFSFDNSHDKFGGEDIGVTTDTCTEMEQRETPNDEIGFYLTGCSKEKEHRLLELSKEQWKEH
ncbi:DUF4362 domain-containing protein [Rossellomorea marisflavi]|uniref:DUF4362 domain-containing protein n=1 Tax=Rossellomorea marisflavi TaxID=189381 RepID=UPI003FA125CD